MSTPENGFDHPEEERTGPDWQVGAATQNITPEDPLRMAGFAARTNTSDGTLKDLHARAIAFEDHLGRRAVIVGTEVLLITRDLRSMVEERIEDEYGVDPAALVLNASHTHYGPEFRESKFDIYGLSEEERARSRAYQERLADELVAVIGEAISLLEPAALQYGQARCGIAMNRRLPTEDGIRFEQAPNGPVDLDVPVLAAYRNGEPVAIVFGYACHPTCLPLITKYSGDWAGHAMANLEDYYDATAVFVQGCGGDIKAYPQNSCELSTQHGRALSNSVRAAMDARMTPVHGPLKAVYEEITVEFEPAPPREELEANLESENKFERRHARLLLDQIEDSGSVPTEYPYPIQSIGFGDDLTIVPMAGEVLVEYSLTLKEQLDGDVWPLGYSNDDFTYVPTERAVYEGGYEGGGVIVYTPYPGPPKPDTETRIIETALALAERTGARRTDAER